MSRIWPLWLCFCNKIHNIEYLQILKMKAMKKVMILSAAALMISLAMPQFTEATTVQNENTMIQVKEVQYQEITVADLPEVVSATITKDYAGCTTDKVFFGDDGTFKVAISLEGTIVAKKYLVGGTTGVIFGDCCTHNFRKISNCNFLILYFLNLYHCIFILNCCSFSELWHCQTYH